jgi:hypothetical protein
VTTYNNKIINCDRIGKKKGPPTPSYQLPLFRSERARVS